MKTITRVLAVITLICGSWASNSWIDENDLNGPADTSPVYQPPIFTTFGGTPPIFGTRFFGNAPTFLYRPAPPVQRPPPVQPPPPQMKDATILCAAILCSPPATCRLVQSCPTCRPRATCLAPAALPAKFDQGCQMYGYKQAVMLHHLGVVAGAATSTTSLRCIPWLPTLTRGGCSPGTACVPYTQPGAPVGTGTCCAGPMAAVPAVAAAASRPPAPTQAAPPPPAAPLPPAQPPSAVPQPAPLVNSAAAPVPTMPRSPKVGSCPSRYYCKAIVGQERDAVCTGGILTQKLLPGARHAPGELSHEHLHRRVMHTGFRLRILPPVLPSSCGGSTCTVPSLPAGAQTSTLQG